MGIQWFILITFVVAFSQGMIYKKWALRKVTYERYFSEHAVFEGDEIQMVERISNNKLLPVPWLRLEAVIHASLRFQSQQNFDISNGEIYQNHKSMFSLMPYTKITRRHYLNCTKRGCYYMNTASMTSGDVLGIHNVTKTIGLSSELLVYPKTVPMHEIPLPSHSWQGDLTVRRWIIEDPFIISGVREYRYGDALNHVNWKATARAGKLQVHNKDFTADHRLMIYVNFDVTENMWDAVTEPERIEKGISYAATIAQNAVAKGVETGFGCNGYVIDNPKVPVRVQPQCSDEHMVELLETMAKLVIARSLPIASFLEEDIVHGTTNTDFLIITSFVSEKMRILIHQLEGNGNSVQIVMLEDEEERAEQLDEVHQVDQVREGA